MRRICENKTYDSSRVLSWSITGTERFRILVSGILTIHFWFLFLLIFNYWHGTTKLALTEGPQASFKDLRKFCTIPIFWRKHFCLRACEIVKYYHRAFQKINSPSALHPPPIVIEENRTLRILFKKEWQNEIFQKFTFL